MPIPLDAQLRLLQREIETRPYPRFGPSLGAGEHCTDLGNGRRMASQHGPWLRYAGRWFVWDGMRWAKDATGEVERRAKETARHIVGEAQAATDDERPKLMKWAMASESATRIRSMIEMARSEPPVAVSGEVFDRDPMLLNCPNGTVDLRTGELRSHRREDMITKVAGAPFDLSATCQLWLAFLARIFDGNESLISYIQRALGYALTGLTAEQVFFFLYGLGKNGKSTLLEVMRAVLGDYALAGSFSMLLVNKNGGGPRNDIARLRGARFVTAIESGAGTTLDEAVVKQLTGGDTIAERALYQEASEFRPTHKLLLAANHKPVIKGTDEAIWRRVHLIPFTVEIPEPERDKHLDEKLMREASGILAWLVGGCLEWNRIGLNPPQEVLAATANYRAEMDDIGPFFDARCVVEPRASVKAGELYAAYKSWAEEVGESPISQTAFGLRLGEKGFAVKKRESGKHRMGIRLRKEGELPLSSSIPDTFSPEEPDWMRS